MFGRALQLPVDGARSVCGPTKNLQEETLKRFSRLPMNEADYGSPKQEFCRKLAGCFVLVDLLRHARVRAADGWRAQRTYSASCCRDDGNHSAELPGSSNNQEECGFGTGAGHYHRRVGSSDYRTGQGKFQALRE